MRPSISRYQRAKRLAIRAGAQLPATALHRLNSIQNYLHLGWWMRAHGYAPPTVSDRLDVYEAIARRLDGERVLYLEFGVASGDSLRCWSSLLTHPGSELHAFDSFEGLPVAWGPDHAAGHFSTGGEPPRIPDDRIRYHVGWFDVTVPEFRLPSGFDRLVVNFDADLYASTALVFKHLGDRMVPGTILYFDEFNHRDDELRAFGEWSADKRFAALTATHDFVHVAFERLV